MIEIPRHLACQLKTVFRRIITASGRGVVNEPVLFHAGPEGLRVRIASCEVAAEYHDPRPRKSDTAIVPFPCLHDCEGTGDEPIQIEAIGSSEVLAAWNDRGTAQLVRYDMPAVRHHFPDLPASFVENAPELVTVLHDAMLTAAPESASGALHCVQLRSSGSIIATDGTQMLLQSGFDFPGDEDLLIPRRLIFGSRELPQSAKVQVGRSDGWVCFRVGGWSFLFASSGEERLPTMENYVRETAHAATSLQIDSQDAAFLMSSMKQLPGDDARFSPVTIDANESIIVRSESDDRPYPVEILLANSTRSGPAARIKSNRTFLHRALELGFRELHLFAPDQPILCEDDRRKYLWAVLLPSEALKPSDNAVRISSDFVAAAPSTTASPAQPETTMTKTTQVTAKQDQPPSVTGSTNELIDTAEQLKASLRDTLGKTNDLIVGLKRHRKEAKIVRSTIDSLRQLQATP